MTPNQEVVDGNFSFVQISANERPGNIEKRHPAVVVVL